MTEPNEDVVRKASAAFAHGDLSALRNRYFAEDVIWHVAGTGPLAGDYEGIAAVMEVLGRVSALADGPVQSELHDVLVSRQHTVALVSMTARRSGKQLQLNLVHVIHGENGKATEIWTHSSDPAGAAEFWA
jgi:uncharacterized protein